MTLEILTSDLLDGVRHGFFTRRGGASSGIFAGLNCGPGSSDQSHAVATNRGRVAQAMGVGPDHLLSLHQIHSADVVIADDPVWTERPRADAAVTLRPGIALGILTADCAPVLFADRAAGVIGAAHAGWRGALGGVIEATIDAMEASGARRDAIRAVIGPTICQRNYEVGPEMLETFLAEEAGWDRHFAPGRGDRLLFDLPGLVLARLRAAGVEAEWIGRCTYADPERFYSYRRTTHAGEPDYGRLISAIVL
jgi:hypothetical protein